MAATTTTPPPLQIYQIDVGNVVRDRKTGMLGLITNVHLDNSCGNDECCGSAGPDYLYVRWQCGHEEDYRSREEEGFPDFELVPDAAAPLALEYLGARDRAHLNNQAMGGLGAHPPAEEVADGTGLGHRRRLDGWLVDWMPRADLAEGWDGHFPPDLARAVRVGAALNTRVLCLSTGQLGTIGYVSDCVIGMQWACGHEDSIASHRREDDDPRWVDCFGGIALA